MVHLVRRVRLVLLVLGFTLGLGVATRPARADAPNPRAQGIYVLDIDSDDAEDQAEALTLALRWKVRQAQGYSLLETTQSLETLIVALKCPSKPDADCLRKIGDQLKADRFIWGYLVKQGGAQVRADLRLWTRGHPDVTATETYAENLKDPNDDALRKIAARAFGRLLGVGTTGSLVVHTPGVESAQVFVDGQPKGNVEHGAAKLDVPAGTHTIEVRAEGYQPASQSVEMQAGGEGEITLTLGQKPAEQVDLHISAPSVSGRRLASYILLGVGVAAGIAAGVEGILFLGQKSSLQDDEKGIPNSVTDVCTTTTQGGATYGGPGSQACSDYNAASGSRTRAFIFGGAAAALIITGGILLLTDKPAESSPAAAFSPFVGPGGGGVMARGQF
jgi:PEGA domain